MTRDEWLDRLDELVAEHVLGWTWWTWTDDKGPAARLHEEMENPDPLQFLRDDFPEHAPPEYVRYTEGIVDGAEIQRPMWCGGEYSRSISDAWKLVEALRRHDEPRYQTLHMVSYPYARTYATFDGELAMEPEEWTEANGPNADALAITLAALRAVGAEIPEEPTRE